MVTLSIGSSIFRLGVELMERDPQRQIRPARQRLKAPTKLASLPLKVV